MGLGITEIILLLVLLCVPIWLIAFVDILKNDFKGTTNSYGFWSLSSCLS